MAASEFRLGEVTFFSESGSFAPPPAETLTLWQLVYLILIIICVIPNAFLIYILIRYRMCRSNFYFVIGNWSLANILQMAHPIYVAILPEVNLSFRVVHILENLNWVISTLPVTFAVLIMFDKFLNSKKFCRYAVYNVWGSCFINIAVMVLCIIFGYHKRLFTIIGFVAIGILATLILIIRTIVYSYRSSDEKNFPLRLAMSFVCIIGNFVLIIVRFFIHTDIPIIYDIITCIINANGVFNFALLLVVDSNIKSNFYQTFRCGHNRLKVQFTKEESIEKGEGDKTENR